MGAMAAAYPILTAMGASVAGSIAVSALTKKPSANLTAPPTPALTTPTLMPTPGDAAATAAKRQSLADQMARQGRASTILTDQPSDKLGA